MWAKLRIRQILAFVNDPFHIATFISDNAARYLKLRLIIDLNLEAARVLDVASTIALIFVLIVRLLAQLARAVVEQHTVLEVTSLISSIAVRDVALIVEV